MLEQTAIPIIVGLATVLTLSRWCRWSRQAKVRAGLIYAGAFLFASFFEAIQGHDWLGHIGIELRSGVFAAFGIGIGISLLRVSATWKGRLGGGLFAGPCFAMLWLRFV